MDNFAFTDIIIKELANLNENALNILNNMIIKGAVRLNDICK